MCERAKTALRVSARIAFAQFDALTERERECVLESLVEVGSDQEAEIAAQQLHHIAEQRRLQMTLRAVLEGVR